MNTDLNSTISNRITRTNVNKIKFKENKSKHEIFYYKNYSVFTNSYFSQRCTDHEEFVAWSQSLDFMNSKNFYLKIFKVHYL